MSIFQWRLDGFSQKYISLYLCLGRGSHTGSKWWPGDPVTPADPDVKDDPNDPLTRWPNHPVPCLVQAASNTTSIRHKISPAEFKLYMCAEIVNWSVVNKDTKDDDDDECVQYRTADILGMLFGKQHAFHCVSCVWPAGWEPRLSTAYLQHLPLRVRVLI